MLNANVTNKHRQNMHNVQAPEDELAPALPPRRATYRQVRNQAQAQREAASRSSDFLKN